MATASHTTTEEGLVEAACAGNDEAFRRLVEPHRARLHAHCYRMLGSLHDAEDALQETLLRAWRGLSGFDGRSALRSWLYKIATNACLDALARRPARVLPIDYASKGEDPEQRRPPGLRVEPYPDAALAVADGRAAPEARYEEREAVELAFVAALQHLPVRQRAALVLRDVLGFSAREAAEALATTPASINSALQRARQTIDDRLPDQSQQATLREMGDDRVRVLVERFTDAMEQADVDGIVAVLAEDATFAMPPYAECFRGRDAIADSWLMPDPPPGRLRLIPTRANAQPAVAAYGFDPEAGCYVPVALDVLALRGDRIAAITAFRTAELFPAFDLPVSLPA